LNDPEIKMQTIRSANIRNNEIINGINN